MQEPHIMNLSCNKDLYSVYILLFKKLITTGACVFLYLFCVAQQFNISIII